MCRKRKQGQATWEEYRHEVWLHRDVVRKTTTKLELNLARDAKNNKKGFYSYINKRGSKKVYPTDKQHWKIGKNRWGEGFVSIFNVSLSSHTYRVNGQQEQNSS